MTTTILAHFDGKVFVPDEPVDVPVGTPLRVRVEAVQPGVGVTSGDLLAPVIIGLDPTLAQAIAADPEFRLENM
jgi:hypothetical protein